MAEPDETFTFADSAAWEAWLSGHHDQSPGVWLRIAKLGSGQTTVTITEALDVALCWGWIDSQRRGLDDTHYLQRYSPRRARSLWSQVNIDKVAALTEAGRMQEPGLAEVRAAQADGRWDAAYVAQRNAEVPDDLAAALAEHPRAQAAYDALGKTDRYLVIHQLVTARTPETRARRLAKALARLDDGS